MSKAFNPERLQRLNDPERLKLFSIEKIIREKNLKNIRKILDLGTGTGAIAHMFLEEIPELNCVGMDISKEMLKWTEENRGDYGGRLTLVHQSQGDRIPLADGSVELVSFVTVYHEVENPKELLKEIKRVLKPGGILILMDWKKESLDRKWGPPSEELYSQQEITVALKRTGFENIEILNMDLNIIGIVAYTPEFK